ncbi:MAG: hypothetical protein A2675_03365 [Candidatus Yonathbacteria bacterium RIFCSPHIGHO2_01_FULL_51_10]|uniref:DUF5652 domain-containing protein n=1 Tax=Candidatus Yonathbacteria bacterium RIFCSPHIGHO2_01_FULL_51_10 TaxID=1802723 RepID=A0A1G2SA07_9BACT|nr:MAG: hypothetical protein A2675_03365 [Candidatus Yonathbacteria bacterium RIFCSPHIGHO2_01_FULL_51_10]
MGSFASFGGLLMIVLVWSLFWKGLALWHSSRRGEPWWFIAMLLINTAGILELVYLFGFASLKFDELFKITEKK